jgi:hypothetical protein
MGAHHRTVPRSDVPHELAGGIGLALERLKQAFPEAGTTPAPEAVVTRLVRPIAVGKVAPGSARTQDPEDAIEHLARVLIRVAPLPIGAGQQRPEPLIVGVGQVSTCHSRRILSLWPWIVRDLRDTELR